MSTTTDRNDPGLDNVGSDGMQEKYLVLSEEERAKGFVRPLRASYRHVGPSGPAHPLQDLTEEQKQRYEGLGYAKYEPYPEGSAALGRYWTQDQLDAVGQGCGTVTSMGLALCETYARDPGFYGATYCVGCQTHKPVGEFRWVEDGEVVGS